jgi:hypothetical protein
MCLACHGKEMRSCILCGVSTNALLVAPQCVYFMDIYRKHVLSEYSSAVDARDVTDNEMHVMCNMCWFSKHKVEHKHVGSYELSSTYACPGCIST